MGLLIRIPFMVQVLSLNYMYRYLVLSISPVHALQPNQSRVSTSTFRYRTVKESDLPDITELLEESFESPKSQTSKPWWTNALQLSTGASESQKKNYFKLKRRWMDMVQNVNVPHTWIVAESIENSKIVGFMELGSMQTPFSNTESAAITVQEAKVSTTEQDGTPLPPLNDSVSIITCRVERPFLANLAVSAAYRRQGIATTLVQLALKISRKWLDDDMLPEGDKSSVSMCLGVDKDNEVAKRLYTSLDFTMVFDETQSLPPQVLNRLNRPPRLYYEKKIKP